MGWAVAGDQAAGLAHIAGVVGKGAPIGMGEGTTGGLDPAQRRNR